MARFYSYYDGESYTFDDDTRTKWKSKFPVNGLPDALKYPYRSPVWFGIGPPPFQWGYRTVDDEREALLSPEEERQRYIALRRGGHI